MDFKDEIKQLAERVIKLKGITQTEEATKNAFVMPFLKALGYDVFNPLEVVPEYITDIGTKKGEKIDYAILKDAQPVMLVECKHWAEKLNLHDGQLLRYFHVSKARFGLLTNGILFRFFTDLVENNKMDEKPFFEFDISEIKDNQIEELKKFHKSYFDVENILTTASELKYTSQLKTVLNTEFNEPSVEFVKFLTKQVYPGRITEGILEQFTSLTKKSINQYISDVVTERLKNALKRETEVVAPDKATIDETTTGGEPESKIETTVEEQESFYIVKAILRNKINSERIFHRDAQSYFTIIVDDNNRKPICRMYFNGSKKYIGIFDLEKKETKFEISDLDDIYKYAVQLENAIQNYITEVSE